MRHLRAPTLTVVAMAAVVAGGCGDERRTSASIIVSGRTIVHGTAESSYVALYESRVPLLSFVQEQAFGEYTGETVEGDADDQGRFTLRANVSDATAAHLILYAKCDRYGCSAQVGCVYRALPPLRRADGRWVVKSTGRPLRVTLRIGVDKPDSPCY